MLDGTNIEVLPNIAPSPDPVPEKPNTPPEPDIEPEISTDSDTDAEDKKRTEKKLDKTDKIFDDLLDEIKDSPEAKREALAILIAQMRQGAIQMKDVSDLEHLQEMKELMLTNWGKLRELAGGDEQLLKTINDWGTKFNEEKVIFYDRINVVKDQLSDQSQAVQENWNNFQIQLGEVVGKISNIHPDAQRQIDEIIYHKDMDLNKIEGGDLSGWRKDISGLEGFIKSLNSIQTGYFDQDLDLESITKFAGKLARSISALSTLTYKNGSREGSPPPIQNYPEIKQILEELQAKATTITNSAKEASKIYKVTKKIRDTHFLPVLNEQPPVS